MEVRVMKNMNIKRMKRVLTSLLAMILIFSLCSCGAMKNWGKPVQSIEAQENTGTESGEEDVTVSEYGDQGTKMVSKKVELPQQVSYPDAEGFGSDESFDDEGFNADYDKWFENHQTQLEISKDTVKKLYEYYQKTLPYMLNHEQGKNILYSPVNVYLALAMLCEITDGETRQQVIEILGEKDIESLRKTVKDVWDTSYVDDGSVTSILAASLWMNQDIKFNQETIDQLAQTYYAESYKGTPGTAEMDKALQNWLNEHTGNLLKEQAGQITLDPRTILALATTLYFKVRWNNEFNPQMNTTETFHAVTGDVEKEFMHSSGSDSYFWGENFSAVSRSLLNSGSMVLILPDEGKTPQDLLNDQETLDFIASQGNLGEWKNSRHLIVHQSIPKFDADSMTDLGAAMKQMGIEDVFDFEKADFSPMLAEKQEAALTTAKHAVRVKIDEEGVEAAAFTVMAMCGSAMPPNEEVDFILDRPFLFVITGANGLPLFTGIVEQP